jgi:hypothetical protein
VLSKTTVRAGMFTPIAKVSVANSTCKKASRIPGNLHYAITPNHCPPRSRLHLSVISKPADLDVSLLKEQFDDLLENRQNAGMMHGESALAQLLHLHHLQLTDDDDHRCTRAIVIHLR